MRPTNCHVAKTNLVIGFFLIFTASVTAPFIFNCAPPVPQPPSATPVETPAISPASGPIERDNGQITMSCTTTGAAIHYTLDGSTPTASSPLYSAPLSVATYA
jgi:hypothetical protein